MPDSPNAIRPERPNPLDRGLRDALGEAGWSARPPREGEPWLLVASKASRRYPVLLNQVSVSRRSSLQGLLADAILRGRAAAGPKGQFLAVVGAPAISTAMAAAIEAYAREVAPEQPFGYVDERGLVRLFGPGLEAVKRDPVRRSGSRPMAGQPRDLFSDLNQWMLKVIVGGKLPAGMIDVPRDPVRLAGDLAARADVSSPAAWRLLASLKVAGYMDEAGQVVRVHDLLARWRAAALRPQRQVAAVWIMPGRNPLERLRASLAEQRRGEGKPSACLGLFAACDALGLGHVRGAPVHLYVRRIEGAQLEPLGLALAPRGQQGDVVLRLARWPESVLRGAVSVRGVPVADIIQCWLDVSAEPARGAEQAAFIWKKVLGPAIAGGGPEP
jgi:hypothetical protein